MSSINNLFNFGRSIPAPFDSVNRRVSVQSKYGDGGQSTLCGNVVKAINAYCACADGSGEGAVGQFGTTGEKTVAEYKSSIPNNYHLVIYDANTGSLLANVFETDTESMAVYKLDSANRDGAAVIFAMMPTLLTDDEFSEHLGKYIEHRQDGFSDMTAATKCLAILCDNVYRRVKDPSCSAHIKVEIEPSGNLTKIPRAQLDSGNFAPQVVTAGEFTIFAKTGATTTIHSAEVLIEQKDFVGKFALRPRTLTPMEQSLVPELPAWYVIPQEVLDVCKHAAVTTGKPTQMRNFLLRGPAGTGKTMGAKAIAAGLGLPYMKYTCSAQTEIYDFIGQIFPDSENESTGDAVLDAELKELKAMGGINYENVSKIMKLPALDDMDYDPEGVYKALTGIDKADATSQDCMSVVLSLVTEKVKALSKRTEPKKDGGQSFTYVETDFIKALENGYVVEIQEPTTIMQPGVLVGLNSLLEQEGSITLPTGRIIKRHPDAVVVVTTNISYEGCRGMNQSIVDRMNLVKDVELPTPEVMVQRAMNVTGVTDEYQISKMVKVVNNMAEYCRKNAITDGTIGMRSLLDWIVSSEITGDAYESALCTIISKATAVEEDREALIVVLEQDFTPRRRRSAA